MGARKAANLIVRLDEGRSVGSASDTIHRLSHGHRTIAHEREISDRLRNRAT